MKGPVLFLIYLNDMAANVDDDCKLMFYADDSAIFYVNIDPDIIA